MLAAGVNFSLYHTMLRRRDASALRDVELRVYLGMSASATVLVVFAMLAGDQAAAAAPFTALLDAAFQVASILTTTGYATGDFAEWPGFARAILVGLMFAGGCAGSTAGGAKIIRILIGWKASMREVRLTFSPNSVIAVTVGRKAVPEESVRAVVALLLLWVAGWGLGAVLLAVGDTDIVTAATASIATLSNIGPGLEAVGPTGNFAFFADWQKGVMIFLMWLGRLEFFAVLALLLPRFWQR
jgi:trk system potassium uptake protein TrkH